MNTYTFCFHKTVPKEKMPRMLLSNSYALKQLLRKAELQGVNEVEGDYYFGKLLFWIIYESTYQMYFSDNR